jgi:hypothetical protein
LFNGSTSNCGNAATRKRLASDPRSTTDRDAGKQIPHLRRIAHIHVLDGERDFPLGQLLHDLRPGERASGRGRRSLSTGNAKRRLVSSMMLATSGASASLPAKEIASTGKVVSVLPSFCRIVLARRLPEESAGRQSVARRKHRRVLVDDGKRTLQNRSGRAPVLAQHNQLGLRKMPAEQMKRRAGCPTKAVNGLIRIANREDVRLGRPPVPPGF